MPIRCFFDGVSDRASEEVPICESQERHYDTRSGNHRLGASRKISGGWRVKGMNVMSVLDGLRVRDVDGVTV
jgi:hypothetical protein